MLGFARHLSVALLILAVAFVGVNATPTALPQGHAQQISVAGTILGLAIIAGIIYLVTQDQQGVYHRYPYGQYSPSGPHYHYQGTYAAQYRAYQNHFYNGPLPGQWSGDLGRMSWNEYHQGWTARCVPQADHYGRWGQQRQWDAWCQQNLRFRSAQPDQLWRLYNPYDTGTSNRPNGPGEGGGGHP
jgi:hypothetical protein